MTVDTGIEQDLYCFCRMGAFAQRLEQLDNEVATLTARVEAAKDAWLSTTDGLMEAKLKEVYEDLKEEKTQLLEGMRALEAKLPGSGERTPLMAYSNGVSALISNICPWSESSTESGYSPCSSAQV